MDVNVRDMCVCADGILNVCVCVDLCARWMPRLDMMYRMSGCASVC